MTDLNIRWHVRVSLLTCEVTTNHLYRHLTSFGIKMPALRYYFSVYNYGFRKSVFTEYIHINYCYILDQLCFVLDKLWTVWNLQLSEHSLLLFPQLLHSLASFFIFGHYHFDQLLSSFSWNFLVDS